jgi:hypothetical protein
MPPGMACIIAEKAEQIVNVGLWIAQFRHGPIPSGYVLTGNGREGELASHGQTALL